MSLPCLPLCASWCHRAERFFAQPFAEVTLHLEPALAEHGLVALAGNRTILIDPARFRPSTPEGQRLLWHELAHLAQQARGHVAHNDSPLVRDPLLEAEADRMAEAAMRGDASAPWISRPVDQPARENVWQPVVTVLIEGREQKFAGGVFSQDASRLWKLVLPFAKGKSKDLLARMEKKLADWVNAAPKAMLWGRKGYDKQFKSVQEIFEALHGRATSRDNRDLERRIALRVEQSSSIKRNLAEFIRTSLKTHHQTWMKDKSKQKILTRVPGGRYAPFYSAVTFLAGIVNKANKSLDEGVTYMVNGGRDGRTIPEVAAFLSDYMMKAREWCLAESGESVASDKVTPLPQKDARRDHHTVNEQSEWVKRARAANVRLGAGPSATTKVVLTTARWMMNGTYSEARSREILCDIALALFAFWNLKREWLMTTSEIHTYHEVMLVAESMGVPLVRSLNLNRTDLAELEYPEPKDIPG
jgi:hypothetical protein